MAILCLFIAMVFVYSLLSRRLERTFITAPIVFTVAGLLIPLVVPNQLQGDASMDTLLHVAEIGLVLLLFTDASKANLNLLRSIWSLPARLLSTGMLLTIVLGGLCAMVIFRGLSIWEAGILAAILAPTDAGLGQVIVNSPKVPLRIRQSLNMEAGLNDGLAVPFLLFFMALTIGEAEGPRASLMRFVVEQLGYGALVGIGIGLLGGALLAWAHRRRWVAESFTRLAVVALPLLCFMVSEVVGASMFIAAFVAGLAVQVRYKDVGKHAVEFSEEWGQLLNLSVFFLFGVLASRSWQQFEITHVLYAVLSLTLVRMLPVAIALRGAGLNRATVLFMGWFGPRGLASIVLGLVYLEHQQHIPDEPTIRLAVMMTVLLSIFAHGMSANLGIDVYARSIAKLPPEAPEHGNVDSSDGSHASVDHVRE